MIRYMCMTSAKATEMAARAVLPRFAPAISTVPVPSQSYLHVAGAERGSWHRTYASTRNNKQQQVDRPFQILGLQQIAVGSLSKESMSNIWIDIFGIEKAGSYQSEKENVDEDILRLGPSGSPYVVEVDLMTPLDPEKRPKVGGTVTIAVSYTVIHALQISKKVVCVSLLDHIL